MLHKLYEFVQKYAPGATAPEEPAKPTRSQGRSTAKPRKNKPMSKAEQEAKINELQGKLKSYQQPGAGVSPEPCESYHPCDHVQRSPDSRLARPEEGGESSDDDDESGSESEEE